MLWSPHDYQKKAIALLLSQGSAGLFLDPGLGKTSVCLAAYKILKNEGYVKKGMLVIAPLRVIHNVWPQEAKKWDNFNDLKVEILHGRDKSSALKRDADIYLINPEGLGWLYDDKSRKWRDWDILCVDESTKFKDSQTKRFKLMRRHFERFSRRWILTGTPVPNGVHDLFGQIYILDLGNSLGKYVTHFRSKYFTTEAWNPYAYRPLPGSYETILERIAPLSMRLDAHDYLKMPEVPPIEPFYFDLPKEALQHYADIEDRFITDLDSGTIVAANAAVAGGKCRQIANGAIYTNERGEFEVLHDCKIDILSDLIEELSGAPLLVMYEFNHDRERLLRAFGASTPILGGGGSTKRDNETIAQFNRGELPLLLGHPASMAHGLNLQEACHHICWFGTTWNLEHYDQANARVYRQGQKNPVFIYHIVARGTLDETVLEVLRAKDRTQKSVLGYLKSRTK